ncbi:hypothetical protein [Nonomuraea wenchangensis]|uniref:hypothetical protein n=1 Tax=Nonomuraea wenchangensis TaxID=568860 RepID=UPI00331B0834
MICSRRPRKDVPLDRLRDRVLFETTYVCGARASEVCGLYVEDLDLRLDDEHVPHPRQGRQLPARPGRRPGRRHSAAGRPSDAR